MSDIDDDGCWEHGMDFIVKRVEPAAMEFMHCTKCDKDVQWQTVPLSADIHRDTHRTVDQVAQDGAK